MVGVEGPHVQFSCDIYLHYFILMLQANDQTENVLTSKMSGPNILLQLRSLNAACFLTNQIQCYIVTSAAFSSTHPPSFLPSSDVLARVRICSNSGRVRQEQL